MSASKLIKEFSQRYPEDSRSKFGQNRSFEIITKQLPEEIRRLCEINTNIFRTYGSAGTGNWAEIPWLAVLDKEITSSTRTGYYVVLLFSKDLKKISICLSLGWTQFEEEYGIKEGRLQIKATCTHYAHLLANDKTSFISGDLALGATNNLGKGYEAGSIIHKTYQVSDINDENIKQDVEDLLNYYHQLKNLVGDSILNIEIDTQKYDEQVQTFKKEVALSTFKPISDKSIAELIAKTQDYSPKIRERLIKQIVRNRKYADYVKQKANFICQTCGRRPFVKANGQPYAEADHIIPLGHQGADSAENLRCLCAQCHAIITYGSDEEIKRLLQ